MFRYSDESTSRKRTVEMVVRDAVAQSVCVLRPCVHFGGEIRNVRGDLLPVALRAIVARNGRSSSLVSIENRSTERKPKKRMIVLKRDSSFVPNVNAARVLAADLRYLERA